MNRIEQFFLRRLCKRLVRQGYDHENNIIEYYRVMQDAMEREFTEDTNWSLRALAQLCLTKV